MSNAYDIMTRANSNALIGMSDDGKYISIIEDVTDPDGRMYRMEYLSTPDGLHAVAYCRYNPWGGLGNPQAGADLLKCHCFDDGLICMGDDHCSIPEYSPYTLQTVISRSRYWCTAFSVLKETGRFPNP